MNIDKLATKRNAYIAIVIVLFCILFGIKINKRMQLNAEIAAEEQAKIDEAAKKEADRAFQQEMRIATAKKQEKEAKEAEEARLREQHVKLDLSQHWEIEPYISNETGLRTCLIKSPVSYIKRLDDNNRNAMGLQLVLVKDTDGSITVGIHGKGVDQHISAFSYNTSGTGLKLNGQYIVEFDVIKNTNAFNLLVYYQDKSKAMATDFKNGGTARAYVRLTNGYIYESEDISLSDFEYAYNKLKTCK